MKNLSNNGENSSVKIYRFGNCCLNTLERKVFKEERLLEIASRAFDILQLLIERQGEIVSKDEILDAVWRDSFVEEGNLTVYVSKLRKSLGANKKEPYIETVSGVGYRFVARVTVVDENELIPAQTIENNLTSNDVDHNSIAVLPLHNENGDEEIDYLTDGITESLINNLSYLPNLRVISRNTVFHYKNKAIDIQKVGKELGVSTVLTGRIRIIRDNLTLSVELTNSENNNQLWGTQINQPFEDIFEVQEKLTRSISENLKSQISNKTQGFSTQTVSQNPESYRLYLKGKYFQNRRSLKNINKAINSFQISISHDPTNPYSYIELASCHLVLYFYEQILHQHALSSIYSLLEKAYMLNQNISEFYVVRGIVKMSLEFNMIEAEKNFKHAIVLNPNLIEAYFHYSKLLCFTGRFAEGLKEIEKMMKLDPISLQTNKNISRLFLMLEQYENAVIKLNECLELAPRDYESLLLLGATLTELEEYDEALKKYYQALDIQHHFETLSMISYTYIRAGKLIEGKKILRQLEEKTANVNISPTYLGIIYSALGEIDKAFEHLENAYKNGNSNITALKIDPRWKPLRHDPRFNDLLIKIGLPTN